MQVALVGSAPSSARIAPYGDSNWQIWGCSPGLYGVAPRVNAWFELHLVEPGQPWFSPEYCAWLKALPDRGVTLWTGAPVDLWPGSQVLPSEELLEQFDPHRWFCTSSLFWMMATAIAAGAKKIGFWGVDMAASEEYEMQRAGIHHLTYIANARGIEVGTPMESDLFTPRFRYGIDEWTHGFRKARARRAELGQRLATLQAEANMKQQEAHFVTGALDDLKYMVDTWIDKSNYVGPLKAPRILLPEPSEVRSEVRPSDPFAHLRRPASNL